MEIKIDYKKILLIIFYVVVFFSSAVLVYNTFWGKSEYQKILEQEVKDLKKEQKILKENQDRNYQKLDSIDQRISGREVERERIIEKYYYDKDKVKQNIEEHENNIGNSNLPIDSLQGYLSGYKYSPFLNPR